MTPLYFEYAISEGEGTLVANGCYPCPADRAWAPLSRLADKKRTMTIATVSAERYAEFITIHGSEVAI